MSFHVTLLPGLRLRFLDGRVRLVHLPGYTALCSAAIEWVGWHGVLGMKGQQQTGSKLEGPKVSLRFARDDANPARRVLIAVTVNTKEGGVASLPNTGSKKSI